MYDVAEWCTFVDDGGSGKDRDRSCIGGAADPFLTHAQLGTTITYSGPRKMQAKTSVDAATATAFVPRMRGSVPAHDKALIDAFHAITDMADRLGLVATVRDRAKEVLKKLEEAKACLRSGSGWNRDSLYAACLHIVCRTEDTPRTLKELASVTGDDAAVKTKDIGKLCNHIKKHLREEPGRGVDMSMVVVHAGDYLQSFGSCYASKEMFRRGYATSVVATPPPTAMSPDITENVQTPPMRLSSLLAPRNTDNKSSSASATARGAKMNNMFRACV